MSLRSANIRMVGKKELFDVPLFGEAMRRAGFIEVVHVKRQAGVQQQRHTLTVGGHRRNVLQARKFLGPRRTQVDALFVGVNERFLGPQARFATLSIENDAIAGFDAREQARQ